MDSHSVDIKKTVRTYVMVFGALMILTFVTVAVSMFHLPIGQAVFIALAVASVKGFLVAGYFMHLISEKKMIYGVLLLTALFFIVLMIIPMFGHESVISNSIHLHNGF